MMPTATIEKLAQLLAEDGRVEGKIREVQAVFAELQKKISQALAQRYMTQTEAKAPLQEDLMQEEQSYERLLRALLDIKNEIAKQIRSVEEQLVQDNIDHLKQTFEHEKNKLGECLEGIDQKVLECRLPLEEYERIRSHLQTLNERLSRLGAKPLPLPDLIATTDLGEIVKGRLEHLRNQGKL